MVTKESGTRDDCLACRINADPSGAPGGRIKEYNYWFLDHIIAPVPMTGWLILKTKRHSEGITGLNREEARELGEILDRLPKIQQELLRAEKIYLCCFAELVSHLHIHLIPQPAEEKYRGPKAFDLQAAVEAGKRQPVLKDEVVRFVDRLRGKLSTVPTRSPMQNLKLEILKDALMVCQLDADAPVPSWAAGEELVAITRTADELSVVCRESIVPAGVRCEQGFRGLKVSGPLNFSLVGILAALTKPLAEQGISVFVVSTYGTDYLLVKANDFKLAVEVLTAHGHRVREEVWNRR